MFGIIKQKFIVLIISIANASNHTLINSHPNEYSHELHYYPFKVKLDRYVGSCNTLHDLCNKVCVPNKAEDINIHVFNITTGVDKSNILTTHIPCKCKCKFDGRKCN